MMFAARKEAEVFSNAPLQSGVRIMFGNAPEEMWKIGEYHSRGESYKYYITEAFSPLVCGIDYGNKEKVIISFEGDIVRWLGVWMNNGSLKGMYNIALEPCTAPYDSPVNAEKENVGSVIESKGVVRFAMHLKYVRETKWK